MELNCLDAFCSGEKAEVLKLLPKLRNPKSIRESRRRSWDGCTLVHYATIHGWEDICKLLVEKYKCEPTAVDSSGMSPLHVACLLGKEASLKYLISLPSVLRRIDDKDSSGRTPLHWACHCHNFALVEILLETTSVNITKEDKSGCTPFKILSKYGYSVLSRVGDKVDWSTQLQGECFFNVFLVGNSGAGKSTLKAAMLELTKHAPTQHGRICFDEELTAGVVPTQCKG